MPASTKALTISSKLLAWLRGTDDLGASCHDASALSRLAGISSDPDAVGAASTLAWRPGHSDHRQRYLIGANRLGQIRPAHQVGVHRVRGGPAFGDRPHHQ